MRTRSDRFMRAGIATVARMGDSAVRLYRDGYKWAAYPGRNPNNYFSEKNNNMANVKRKLFIANPAPRKRARSISLPFQVGSRVLTPRKGGKYTKTPSGTMVKKRRTGAINSKSMGKLKTRKFRPTKRLKNAMKGVEATYEFYKEYVTTAQTAWVGHSVTFFEGLRLNVIRLILKKVFAKAGQNITNFGSSLASNGLTQPDVIRIRYQTQDGSVGSVEYVVANNVTETFNDVAFFFYNNANLKQESVILKHILLLPMTNALGAFVDVPSVRLDLEHSYISSYFKSSMKIQNRTVNGIDTATDEVDNVPLYGRQYGGTGNGAEWQGQHNGPDTKKFISNYNSGYIEGSANSDDLKEPIHQMYFKYVTQKGKIHLDPGYIKTSVLTYKRNSSISVLWNKLNMLFNTEPKNRDSFGVFRFFGIERMIDTSVEGNITLGLEINHYMNLSLYTKFSNKTAPVFGRSILG